MTQLDSKPLSPARSEWRLATSRPSRAFGRWLPVQLVAESSTSRVFRARACREAGLTDDNGLQRPVEDDQRPAVYAIKVLREDRQDDAGAVATICREVQAARGVCNPHVIPVLAAALHGPPYYLVTPWLPGRTLAARLSAGEPLDLPVALWITRQLAEAIDGMSAAGWMHGDIKPENVVISPEGHVTLLDLGFARRVSGSTFGCERKSRNLLAWRYFTGTGSYLAPEAVTRPAVADIRADIYSLGVVLFEMLSGRLPFEGPDLATIIARHQEAVAANPRRRLPQIPVEVVYLLRQMLSKQPLRRPSSPQELIERLAVLEILAFSERSLAGGLL